MRQGHNHGLVLIRIANAPQLGAFSHAIKTGLWKGLQRGHGIEDALFVSLSVSGSVSGSKRRGALLLFRSFQEAVSFTHEGAENWSKENEQC